MAMRAMGMPTIMKIRKNNEFGLTDRLQKSLHDWPRNKSGSLAILAAMRRASSPVISALSAWKYFRRALRMWMANCRYGQSYRGSQTCQKL